jgi:hypothetical protein
MSPLVKAEDKPSAPISVETASITITPHLNKRAAAAAGVYTHTHTHTTVDALCCN